ncbi:hypothetical protein BC826DRAFT_353657 [Russula brevipes]|nr:hypothetical protein BC826DRAFT_353657 [Russula brevipes]
MTTVFYIGATGYVGGAVLVDLLEHYPNIEVTALVRNPAHLGAIRGLGVEVIQGDFHDSKIIEEHARQADITINSGDSDDVKLNTAILAGQRQRVHDLRKPPPALLHTSGVLVFNDGTNEGRHDPNGKVWNDGDEEDIRAITVDMLHGQVDAPILRASEKGDTVSYIVCPGGIFGLSKGKVPTTSTFVRATTQLMSAFGHPIYIGEGSSVFYGVLLDDLIKLYRLLFARILSGEDAKASPYSRYYVAASTPLSWKYIATVFGDKLKQLGMVADGTPESIPVTKLDPPFTIFVGSSQHIRAERAKALGWEARPVVLEDLIEEDIKATLAKTAQKT